MSARILIVDADPFSLRFLERALQRAGYGTATASEASEAVRLASRNPIDVALVESVLRDETGLDVLGQLRITQPSCLRILMTPAGQDDPAVNEAVNRGHVLRLVRKPVDVARLLTTLDECFASARRMGEVAAAQMQAASRHMREVLDDCLEQRLLDVAVQPIQRATNREETVAWECLLRPRHHVFDTPLGLIRAAERNDRIHKLGRVICELASDWFARIPPDARLFVKLHPMQLADPAQLADSIGMLSLFADRVTFEITERYPLSDIALWPASADIIRRAGFSLAIDDMGVGNNSLAMIADLQPRFLKLDMSLVRHIDQEPRKQRLVRLMAAVARFADAETVAEGIETAAEADAVTEAGVGLLQGYYFGRPMLELPGQQ